MNNCIRKKHSAFTLLEILVALSIAALIMGTVYGSYRATANAIVHCRQKSVAEQQARLFLQRLTSELRCSYAGSLNSLNDKPIKETLAQGSFQKKESPLFSCDGISSGKIFLRFVTSSFTSSPYQNTGGLAIVSYKLDNSGNALLRNVSTYIKGYEQDETEYQWQPVLSNVKNMKCEFLGNDKWQEKWKSTESNVLPKAVKISLVLDDGQSGPVTFESCADIMCGMFQNSEAIKPKTIASNM